MKFSFFVAFLFPCAWTPGTTNESCSEPSSPLQSPWDANAWETAGGRNFWRKPDAANQGETETSERRASDRSKPDSARAKKPLGTHFPDRQPEK